MSQNACGITSTPKCLSCESIDSSQPPTYRYRDESLITRSEHGRRLRHKTVARGFTLIELLVTIAIIGLISTLAVIALNSARAKSKEAKVMHELKLIHNAISMLANDTGLWPGRQKIDSVCSGSCGNNEICDQDKNGGNCGVTKLLSNSSSGIVATDGNYPGWSGPYLNSVPKDPWGYEYFFDTDYSVDINEKPCACGGGSCKNVVAIGSYGPDGLAKPTGGSGSYGCDDVIKIISK